MANKPRMGSDPFQKKDPLGWIGSDRPEELGEEAGATNPTSNPGIPSRAGKQGVPSTTSTQSKHELPGPPGTPEHPSTPSGPRRGTTTSKGLRPGWTRATFIVREETAQQLKAVAYWDRKELKRVVEEAFRAYLAGKKVQPVPAEDQFAD